MSDANSEPIIIPDPYALLFLNYPDVVTVEQMCEMLGGISTKTAYKLLQAGRIYHFRIGRTYKIPKLSVIVYLREIMNPNTLSNLLFADFMEQWLEMMKRRVELTTHSAYTFGVKGRFVPYFQEKGIRLNDIQPKHLHDFYEYVLITFKLSATFVQHFHAYIRQALQHAFKMDLILTNPADIEERPKKESLRWKLLQRSGTQ